MITEHIVRPAGGTIDVRARGGIVDVKEATSQQNSSKRLRAANRARNKKAGKKSKDWAPAPMPASGRAVPPRWGMEPLALDANSVTPESALIQSLEPYSVAAAYVQGMQEPWNARSGTMRMNTNDNCIPAEAYHCRQSTSLTIANGSAGTDGSFALILRGDVYHTIMEAGAIAANHAITWAGGTALDTYTPYSSYYVGRPVVTYARLLLHSFGDPHPVTVAAVRVPPSTFATQLAWSMLPAATNAFLSTQARELLGGVEGVLSKSGDSIAFRSHVCRGDVDRETFIAMGNDRGLNGMMGWVIWGYGLRNTDQLYLDYGSHCEYIAGIYATGPLKPSLLASVAPNGAASDIAASFSDTMTTTGHDASVKAGPTSTGNMQKVLNILWSEKSRDTLDNAVEAVANVVAGNYWGAGKAAYRALQPWLLMQRAVKTPNGLFAIHPSLFETELPPVNGRPVTQETKDALDKAENDFLEVRRPSVPLQAADPRLRGAVPTPRGPSQLSQVLPSGKQASQ